MIVTGNFSDMYGTSMLPALRSIVRTAEKKRPAMWSKVFNVLTSSQSIEQYTQVSGVGRFQQITQGKPVQRDQPNQGFRSTFEHTRWGLSVATTVDLVEDDKWNLIGQMHADLGWSQTETLEIDCWGTFNNGFSSSFPGPDAKALFASDHPLYKAGGTQSNLMTAADLDMTSLQLALRQFELMKRPSGEYMNVAPARLICHPTNRWMAHRLTASKDDPTTADRSVNPLEGAEHGMPMPMVVPYLSAQNSWFLAAEPTDTGLVFFWRKSPYDRTWTDDETEVGIFARRYKKSHGIRDYVGIVGNQGS